MLKERIIWMVLITAGLTWLGSHYIPRPQENPMLEKQFWIKKTFASPVYDMVFIGDSRTYRGIDPIAMGKACGNSKVLNFGYSSAGLTTAFIHEGVSKLSSNGKKIVVFGLTPYALTTDAGKNGHFYEQKNRKREEILEAKYFSSVMYFFRPVNPQFILEKRYLEEKQLEAAPDYYHQDYMPDGWVASWKKQNDLENTLKVYEKSFATTQINQGMVNAFIAEVKNLETKGYTVYGVRPPIDSALLALEEKHLGREVQTIIQQFEAAGGTWLPTPLTTTGSYDGSHLEAKAASNFSEQVGKMITEKIRLNHF